MLMDFLSAPTGIFWWKGAISGQHFVAIEALLALLGLRHHWSTVLNGEIIAVSRIEAVWGPGRCYMLPFVDCVKQLVIFVGVEFSRTGHQKNIKKWNTNMAPWYVRVSKIQLILYCNIMCLVRQLLYSSCVFGSCIFGVLVSVAMR